MKYSELFESRDAALYHGTSWVSAAHIVEGNAIEPRTKHYASTLYASKLFHNPVKDDTLVVDGVSLSRDYNIGRRFGNVVFVLDQRTLAFNHRIIPLDYWSSCNFSKRGAEGGLDSGEAEEFVVGPIKPLDRYLIEIRIKRKWYDGNFANGAAERMYNNGVSGLPLLIAHPKLRLV